MHKIGDDTPTADINGEFQEVPTPTDLRATWANTLQREMVYMVEQSGLVLNQADDTQVYQAIQRMIKEAQKRVIISDATFAVGVADGEAVYWDDVASNFDKAIADGTNKQQAVGFADVTNTSVYAFGDAPLLSGLTPGARYYLSTVTAGQITAVAPAPQTRVTVGIAKTVTTLFVDIDVAQDDVTLSQLLRVEASAENSGGPGIVAGSNGTPLVTLDLGTVEVGDVVAIQGNILATSITTPGNFLWIVNPGGTAVVKSAKDLAFLSESSYVHAGTFGAGPSMSLSGTFIVEAAGTMFFSIAYHSVDAAFSIAPGAAELRGRVFIGS